MKEERRKRERRKGERRKIRRMMGQGQGR